MDPERTAKKNMKFSTAAFMTGTPAQIKASRSKGDAVSMVVDIRRSTHNAVLCKERWEKMLQPDDACSHYPTNSCKERRDFSVQHNIGECHESC